MYGTVPIPNTEARDKGKSLKSLLGKIKKGPASRSANVIYFKKRLRTEVKCQNKEKTSTLCR